MKLHDLGHLGYYNEKLRTADTIIKQIHIGEQKFCKSEKGVVVNYLNPRLFSEVVSVLSFSVSFRGFLDEFKWAIDKFISTSFFEDDLREYVDLYFDNIVSSLQARVDELGANEEELFMAKFFDKAVTSKLIDNVELDDISDFALSFIQISTLSFGKSKSSLCYKGVSAFYTKELVRLVEYQRLEIYNHFFFEQTSKEFYVTEKGKELLLNHFALFVEGKLIDLEALISGSQMQKKIKVKLKKGVLIEFFKRMKYNGFIRCKSNELLASFISHNFRVYTNKGYDSIDTKSTLVDYLNRVKGEPPLEKMILQEYIKYVSPNDRKNMML